MCDCPRKRSYEVGGIDDSAAKSALLLPQRFHLSLSALSGSQGGRRAIEFGPDGFPGARAATACTVPPPRSTLAYSRHHYLRLQSFDTAEQTSHETRRCPSASWSSCRPTSPTSKPADCGHTAHF